MKVQMDLVSHLSVQPYFAISSLSNTQCEERKEDVAMWLIVNQRLTQDVDPSWTEKAPTQGWNMPPPGPWPQVIGISPTEITDPVARLNYERRGAEIRAANQQWTDQYDDRKLIREIKPKLTRFIVAAYKIAPRRDGEASSLMSEYKLDPETAGEVMAAIN